jgi:hypothetical protein
MFNPLEDGATLWRTIHLMSSNANTPRKRELYVNWLNSLKESFPCEKCRLHLIKNLEEPTEDGSVGPGPVEPYSNSNVSLFRHSWKLHDTVNRQLKKPKEQCLTFEQAFEIYFKTKVPVAIQDNQTKQLQSNVVPTKQTSIRQKGVARQKVASQNRTQERFLAAASYKAPQTILENDVHNTYQDLTEPIQESPRIRQTNNSQISAPIEYVDEPIQMPSSLQCTSCGMPEEPVVTVEPKVDYDIFRAKARRTFTAKN